MQDPSLTWLPDGFRFRLVPEGAGPSPLPALASLYLACAPALVGATLSPALAPMLLALLLPLPTALLWAMVRRGDTVLEVDHRRLVVRGPLWQRREVPLRSIHHVEVRLDGLELSLSAGRSLRVPAPTSQLRLWWIAARIHELRDEVRSFEAEIRGRTETAAVLAVARAAVRAAE
ncbi:MAG: hypothetical protein ABMB14_09770 [Myxococcota bacterium]